MCLCLRARTFVWQRLDHDARRQVARAGLHAAGQAGRGGDQQEGQGHHPSARPPQVDDEVCARVRNLTTTHGAWHRTLHTHAHIQSTRRAGTHDKRLASGTCASN
eukprot:2716453-Prymnesium_polylepis.1